MLARKYKKSYGFNRGRMSWKRRGKLRLHRALLSPHPYEIHGGKATSRDFWKGWWARSGSHVWGRPWLLHSGKRPGAPPKNCGVFWPSWHRKTQRKLLRIMRIMTAAGNTTTARRSVSFPGSCGKETGFRFYLLDKGDFQNNHSCIGASSSHTQKSLEPQKLGLCGIGTRLTYQKPPNLILQMTDCRKQKKILQTRAD